MASNAEDLAGMLKVVAGGKKLDRYSAPDDDPEALVRRYRELSDEFQLFANQWQQNADYVTPRKNSIIVQRLPGQKRTGRMYDSTGPDCRDKLVSLMHGTLTPAYLQWIDIETDQPELNAIQSVAQCLQECASRFRNWINRSNYDSEAHEKFTDLVTFANACVFFEEAPRTRRGKFGGFRFRSVNVGKFVWGEGEDGKVNVVFRTFPKSVTAIRTKWLGGTFDGDRTPAQTRELGEFLKDMKPDRKLNIVHGVYPAEERIGSLFKSCYLLLQNKIPLERGMFHEFPYVAVRWAKVADETYGRGPTDDAMPDIMSLNKIVELELGGKALSIRPVIVTRTGSTVGPIRLFPNAQVTVNGDKDSIWKLDLDGDFEATNLKKEELVASIRRIFYYDQATLPQGPQMTAEEVASRMELMYRLLGPTAGRIDSEDLRPTFDRGWSILYRAHMSSPEEKILPEFPPELTAAMQKGPVRLACVFKGPLARAQQSQDAVAVKNLFAQVTQLAAVQPSIVDVVDFDEGMRVIGRATGVPAAVIRDADAVGQIRKQAAAQQAQQQQQEQLAQAAEAAGKAAPALKLMGKASEPGSADAMLTQSMQNGGANGAAPAAAA